MISYEQNKKLTTPTFPINCEEIFIYSQVWVRSVRTVQCANNWKNHTPAKAEVNKDSRVSERRQQCRFQWTNSLHAQCSPA